MVARRYSNRCRLRSRSGSRKEEEGGETAVAVAVNFESGSNFVRELPPRSSSARAPFSNLSLINSDLALARTLQEQLSLSR
ncbi:hypothetical protein Bca101_043327 [Brassica carinata]